MRATLQWARIGRQAQRCAAALLFLFALSAPEALFAEPALRTATALPLNGEKIRLDGLLDENVWSAVPSASDFVQKTPAEGAPSTRKTEVSFLFDDEALYVGARMESEGPGDVRAIVSRRDNAGSSERIVVSMDTYHDARTCYSFAVTASGVRIDYYHPRDAEFDRDYSFDPVWEARTSINGSGWTAEMRIPFSQLRFNGGVEQVWGLNLNRWMPDRNEDTYWVCIPKNETGWSSRFGELRGIEGIRPSRRIEILPYVAGDARFRGDVDPDDPFAERESRRGHAGADLKMGFGPNVTLEGTVNPDFGQVEADPAEVNLSAYETYFEERRPFFVEGSRLLRGDGPAYFYSRRIGAPPHGEPDADYVDAPDHTTILGASKITGRMAGGLSVGALAAATDEEFARVAIDSTGARERVLVEPATGYGVLRLQQEIGEDHSTVGVTLTGVDRRMNAGEPLRAELARRAIAGGADWRLGFHDKEYSLIGGVGFSSVSGDSGAITAAQRSSAHYFQRPDADEVRLDSSRTSLSGYGFSLWGSRDAGDHWLWEVGVEGESPGFEINDAGRLHAADEIGTGGILKYRETKPGRVFRDYHIALGTFHEWNYDGDCIQRSADLSFVGSWRNHWSSWCGIWGAPRFMSDDLTRGGPLMERFSAVSSWAGAATNQASDTRGEIEAEFSANEVGVRVYGTHVRLSTRGGGRWEFSLDPSYTFSSSARQYVDTIEDGPEATFGKRYVFSWIEQSIVSTRLRLNYAFSPDLTLELYAEPFAASGRYHDYGELRRPGDRYILTYGEEGGSTVVRNEDGTRTVTVDGVTFDLDNNDFNYLSFRSNAVLRWEWRRGSTLYLVWQMNRESEDEQDAPVGGRDLWDTLGAPGDNILALKISYWFPVR